MHPALLSAYAIMLPRLQAAECMLSIQAVALGTGSLKKAARDSLLRKLVRQAGGRRQVVKPPQKLRRSVFAMLGIGFNPPPGDK